MKETTRYELPAGGISLLGYIVRRMHKTAWLVPVSGLLSLGETAKALEHIAIYAAVSSSSYGRAYYQPRFDSKGDSITEPDPATGASVTARLNSLSPSYQISYEAILPDGDRFNGSEEIAGTTIGLGGLGMPAPSRFGFTSGEYNAELTGVITSELVLSILGRTRIRAHGFLNFRDNAGNDGRLKLTRDSSLTVNINDQAACYSILELSAPETS